MTTTEDFVQCVVCQGIVNHVCRCSCGHADPDADERLNERFGNSEQLQGDAGSDGDARDIEDPCDVITRAAQKLLAAGQPRIADRLVRARAEVERLQAAALAARQPAQGGTLIGWRMIDGVRVFEVASHSGIMEPQQFVRYDDYLAARQLVGFDFLAHLQRQREWSARTFGPGDRAAGVVDHIRKELREIESDPRDLAEWIDVAILALDGAWRSGASAEEIIAGLVAKQTRNEGRAWPDWRTADPNKAIEHDRSGDAPPAPAAAPMDEKRKDLIDQLHMARDMQRAGGWSYLFAQAADALATHPQPAAAKEQRNG